MSLYTIHQKRGRERLRIIRDRFSVMALLLWPLWLLWNGLWITTLLMMALMIAVGMLAPFAILPVNLGVTLILALEGATFIRAELRMRGWHEVGVVEARSEAGAEELFLSGRAV